ncbi:serine hydrolase domain-containing protein [Marinimicrobium agarilyticum]|uniref:serine hydrolase domain-containing protein n=1 Tax=Marinimicrobium agarilyticum TaxID=306546 RepID=UPI00042077E0|nr:serine hydrolase domain-containing protein [Marinimicrobium agarilyticum]
MAVRCCWGLKLAALWSLTTLGAQAVGDEGELSDRPVDYVLATEQYVVEEVMPHIPGAALAIIADGQIELLQGYGAQRNGGSEPIGRHTVFRLASVSKTIAGTAAGLAVHANDLHWETPVKDHLTLDFRNPEYSRKITLQSLLSHTTGLMPQAYTNLIEANVPYREVIDRLDEVSFICPPSSCYSYQNVAFSLVGDVLLAATGETYEDYVERRLFEPLGMDDASFGWRAFTQNADRATPHIKVRGRWHPVEPSPNYYHVVPAAGANASILDMALWVRAQLGQRPDVLPPELLDQLHSPQVATSYRQAHYRAHPELSNIHYGLGWRLFDFGGNRHFVHHGGWVQGTRTEVLFNREHQLGLVFLSNSENRYAREVVYRFLELYTDYYRQVEAPPLLQQAEQSDHDS